MDTAYNNEVKVDYINEHARICIDMDNTAETYLKRGITKETFFNFVNQIVEMMDKSDKYNLQTEFDLNKMAVEGDKIYFRTCIGKSQLDMYTIKSYLKEIAYKAVFQGNDFLQTVYEYLAFMDSEKVNSIEDIRRQLNIWIYGNDMQGTTVVRPEPVRQPEVAPPPVYTPPVSSYTPPVYREVGDTMSFSGNLRREESFMEQEDNGAETGVLNPDFWKNMMQKNSSESQPGRVSRQIPAAGLYYMKTGVRVSIEKAEFVVGKGPDADFKISQPSISRMHAKIICRDEHFFLVDNMSTNGTYVNGRKIDPNTSVEIKNGDLLRFSNEELKFFIG